MAKPHLNDIIKVFLKLINEYKLESIVNSLTKIFTIFKNEVTIICIDILQSLVQIIETTYKNKNFKTDKEKERLSYTV